MAVKISPLPQPTLIRSDTPTNGWSCETGFVSDLLVRCGRSDQGALALLFDMLCPVVTSAVSLGVEAPRVSDGVRDAFVRIWRDSPEYRPGQVSAVEWIMDRVEAVTSRNGAARAGSGLADAG